ncbi:MAG: ribonuclease HI [Bacteroidetes bacterium QH_7_62_13]|nr:MAG: ribonuclease HI [Bacteroidetes bacterium QH_7_62_13]
MKDVTIYTDGACSGNPGPGGWAAILIPENNRDAEKRTGGEPHTTNNRMELTAALEALRALDEPASVTLHTDSAYLSNAFNEGWLDSWQENDWQTSSNDDVKNKGLWQALLEEADRHDVEWVWVKGHADNELNNKADELAVAAMEEFKR